LETCGHFLENIEMENPRFVVVKMFIN
jgi:hypothetical protein